MPTRMATAEATRDQIIQDVIHHAKVFPGGAKRGAEAARSGWKQLEGKIAR
jgi:hypothetical protein